MSQNRPRSGSMVWWRFKSEAKAYDFGYVTYVEGPNLIRMGRWNGDTIGGQVVDIADIEWKPYRE